MMLLNKLKAAAIGTLVAFALTGGVGFGLLPAHAGDEPKATQASPRPQPEVTKTTQPLDDAAFLRRPQPNGATMSGITRRDAVRIITAGAAALAVEPQTGEAAEKPQPLTPETIVAKKFEGKATIEFHVGDEGTGGIQGGGIMYGGVAGIHLCPAKQPKGDGRVLVWILMKPARDLFRLGIDPGDPGAHFRGKVIRVTGQVKRVEHNTGVVYELRVENLDQFDEVRQVKK